MTGSEGRFTQHDERNSEVRGVVFPSSEVKDPSGGEGREADGDQRQDSQPGLGAYAVSHRRAKHSEQEACGQAEEQRALRYAARPLEVPLQRGRGEGVKPQLRVFCTEALQLTAEQQLPASRHHLIQRTGHLQVVGELESAGGTDTFSTAARRLHPAELVSDVGLSPIFEPCDGVAQRRHGPVRHAGRPHLLQHSQDVVYDAVLAVVQQAEVSEGVVEAQHWNLDVCDGAVKLVRRKHGHTFLFYCTFIQLEVNQQHDKLWGFFVSQQ